MFILTVKRLSANRTLSLAVRDPQIFLSLLPKEINQANNKRNNQEDAEELAQALSLCH